MTAKKQPTYAITGCTITAEAANVTPEAANALAALARASEQHAVAIQKIADALRGEGGTVKTGVHIGDKHDD